MISPSKPDNSEAAKISDVAHPVYGITLILGLALIACLLAVVPRGCAWHARSSAMESKTLTEFVRQNLASDLDAAGVVSIEFPFVSGLGLQMDKAAKAKLRVRDEDVQISHGRPDFPLRASFPYRLEKIDDEWRVYAKIDTHALGSSEAATVISADAEALVHSARKLQGNVQSWRSRQD